MAGFQDRLHNSCINHLKQGPKKLFTTAIVTKTESLKNRGTCTCCTMYNMYRYFRYRYFTSVSRATNTFRCRSRHLLTSLWPLILTHAINDHSFAVSLFHHFACPPWSFFDQKILCLCRMQTWWEHRKFQHCPTWTLSFLSHNKYTLTEWYLGYFCC